MTLLFEPRIRFHGGLLVRISPRLIIAAAIAATVAGCGPSHPAPTASASPSPAASASPSATPTQAGAATAMDAYRGMWKAYVEAIKIPDPAYPGLAKYTQGDALNVFVKGLTNVKNTGLVGQGDVTIHPAATAANPDSRPPTVNIQDCVDTSQSHLVKKDGSPYQDTPGGNTKATATVSKLPDGSWKVSSFALFAVGSC
jgi:hypothetical protein